MIQWLRSTRALGFAILASALVLTNAIGQARVSIVMPPGLAPGTLYLQGVVLDATSPNGLITLSNGVAMQLL